VLLSVAVLSTGCGDVLFVPSPYTPQNVDLVYSTQEDITIVRWRISSTAQLGDDLQFQILGVNGNNPIDFSQSLFPGGGSLCADGVGSCFQYVLPGPYSAALYPRPVQAVQSTYGTLPGSRVTPRTEDQTLSVSSFFHTNNDLVYVDPTDTVAYESPYVYPRSYERTMWPTDALCVSDSAPAYVSFSPLDPQTYGFPPDLPLTDRGIYCVGIRPIRKDGDVAKETVAQGRVATQPQVTDMQQKFTPPVEQSPVMYQIIFDLDIPNPDRCPVALTTIEATVDHAMNMAHTTAPPVKLKTMNVAIELNATDASGPCTQQDAPMLQSADMAQAVYQQISQSPETYQQYHLFFFSNLDSPLAPSLNSSLSALFNDLGSPPSPHTLDVKSWLFAPPPATVATPGTTSPNWWMVQTWQDFADPMLAQTLDSYAQQNLPYETQVHDQNVPIPLLSPDDAVSDDGGWIKICDSTLPLTPVDIGTNPLVTFPYPHLEVWPVIGANPPGYQVSFPPNDRIPFTQFAPQSVALDFQVCTAYCTGHPYVSTGGTGVTSWAASPLCAVFP
jgi:hypothetical protein